MGEQHELGDSIPYLHRLWSRGHVGNNNLKLTSIPMVNNSSHDVESMIAESRRPTKNRPPQTIWKLDRYARLQHTDGVRGDVVKFGRKQVIAHVGRMSASWL